MALKIRSGTPTTATIISAGTPGTSADTRNFGTSYARPMLVTNNHATEALNVSINGITSTATVFMWQLAAGDALDPTFRGLIDVHEISLYYATVAYSNAIVLGWKP